MEKRFFADQAERSRFVRQLDTERWLIIEIGEQNGLPYVLFEKKPQIFWF